MIEMRPLNRQTVMPMVVVVALLMGLLAAMQLTEECAHWRAWKGKQDSPGVRTMDQVPRPLYCVGF